MKKSEIIQKMKIVVNPDSELSITSTNTLQNKVITENLNGKENTSNKVTTINDTSTDVQYPTAKSVYTELQNIEVGGRNYIKYGKGDSQLGLFKNFDKVENGYAEITLTSNNTTIMKLIDDGFLLKCRDYEVGRTIVFSYDIMYTNITLDEGASIKEFSFGQRYTSSSTNTSLTSGDGLYRRVTMHTPTILKDDNGDYILNQWIHVRKLMTIPEQAESTIKEQTKIEFLVQNGNGSITFRMKNVKIEYGNKETDFRPSLEEFESIDNKTTDILNSANTDIQYPSAKAVYNSLRKVIYIGNFSSSDYSGWFKVCSQTCSKINENQNITFMVTSSFGSYASGILQIQIRSNPSEISCIVFGWLTRNGFNLNDFIIVLEDRTWSLYVKRAQQYNKICFEILSSSSLSNKENAWDLQFNDNDIKEDTDPTPTVISKDINRLIIGGRNLLLGTSTQDTTKGNRLRYIQKTENKYKGCYIFKGNTASCNIGFNLNRVIQDYSLRVGDTLTYSIYVKTDEDENVKSFKMYYQPPNSSEPKILKVDSITINSIWTRLICTFNITQEMIDNLNTGDLAMAYACTVATQSGKYLYYAAPQLELGNNATDYKPSPEDIDDKLQEVFQSGSNGKNSIEFAITAQGGIINKSGDVATFSELYNAIMSIKSKTPPFITLEKDKWYTNLTPMTEKRNNFSCIALGKYIYAIGGYNGETIVSSVEKYNTETDEWTTCTPIPTPVRAFGACEANGLIYVIGGRSGTKLIDTVQVYNPAINEWTTKTSMPIAKGAFIPAVINNKIYCIAGYDSSNKYISSMCIYDIETDIWSTNCADLPTPLGNYFLNVSGNNIYILGGRITNTTYDTVYCYNVETNTWTTKTSMPIGKQSGGSVIINNKIYCFGGLDNTVEIYDIETDTWSNGTNMPDKRSLFNCILINGIIYCIGGSTTTSVQSASDNIYNTIEAYVPA